MVFDWVQGLFSNDLAIDLGTATTLIYVRGKGIVIHITKPRKILHKPVQVSGRSRVRPSAFAHFAFEIGFEPCSRRRITTHIVQRERPNCRRIEWLSGPPGP